MSTSTVLRIKRKLEDNPHNALLVTCKRRKFNKEDFTPAVFVLRGTVKNQEDTHAINLVPGKNTQVKLRKNINDIIEKVRKERREISLKNRYEVINFSRNLNSDDDKKKKTVFIDVQNSEVTEKDGQSAYDLYTAEGQDFNLIKLEDLVCIETVEEMFGKDYDIWDDSSSSEADDDDSEDENNSRNHYPEDSDSSDSTYMVGTMQRCHLDDLSSDTTDDIVYKDSFMVDDRYGGPTTTIMHNGVPDQNSYSDQESDDGFYYGEDEDRAYFHRLNVKPISKTDYD